MIFFTKFLLEIEFLLSFFKTKLFLFANNKLVVQIRLVYNYIQLNFFFLTFFGFCNEFSKVHIINSNKYINHSSILIQSTRLEPPTWNASWRG